MTNFRTGGIVTLPGAMQIPLSAAIGTDVAVVPTSAGNTRDELSFHIGPGNECQ